MLLRWFTEVCDLDVLKNVALLGVIRKYRSVNYNTNSDIGDRQFVLKATKLQVKHTKSGFSHV